MDVFQRTPPWVLPKPDFAHGPAHQAGSSAASRRCSARCATRSTTSPRAWSYGLARDQSALAPDEALGRWLLRRQVKDPVLREKLSPDYRIGCKRIVFANDYFPALAAPNADVVTDPISEVVADGIVTADGTHRRYDTILLGTGFRVFGQPTPIASSAATGDRSERSGSRPGRYAYRGTAVAGFPNHFLIIGPNTGLGNNSMINTIEAQVEYVIDACGRWTGRASRAWTCDPRRRTATTSRSRSR